MILRVNDIFSPISGFNGPSSKSDMININPLYGQSPKNNSQNNIEENSNNQENSIAQKDKGNKPSSDKPKNAVEEAIKQSKIQQEISKLQAMENQVIAHEAAHKSVGGSLAGAPSYQYTVGPDGKTYITGGEVPINISKGKTPQETISRMRQVRAAALAPADPSPQDYKVAATASQIEMEARLELLSQKDENQLKANVYKAKNPNAENNYERASSSYAIKQYNNVQNASFYSSKNLIGIG